MDLGFSSAVAGSGSGSGSGSAAAIEAVAERNLRFRESQTFIAHNDVERMDWIKAAKVFYDGGRKASSDSWSELLADNRMTYFDTEDQLTPRRYLSDHGGIVSRFLPIVLKPRLKRSRELGSFALAAPYHRVFASALWYDPLRDTYGVFVLDKDLALHSWSVDDPELRRVRVVTRDINGIVSVYRNTHILDKDGVVTDVQTGAYVTMRKPPSVDRLTYRAKGSTLLLPNLVIHVGTNSIFACSINGIKEFGLAHEVTTHLMRSNSLHAIARSVVASNIDLTSTTTFQFNTSTFERTSDLDSLSFVETPVSHPPTWVRCRPNTQEYITAVSIFDIGNVDGRVKFEFSGSDDYLHNVVLHLDMSGASDVIHVLQYDDGVVSAPPADFGSRSRKSRRSRQSRKSRRSRQSRKSRRSRKSRKSRRSRKSRKSRRSSRRSRKSRESRKSQRSVRRSSRRV
jgi:hypothetical protein